MAPEMLVHKPYNMKVDIYSFAIVLWELLAGRTPYAFVRRQHHLIQHVVNENGRPDILENWPESIKVVLRNGFDADIKTRPVSCYCYYAHTPKKPKLHRLNYCATFFAFCSKYRK